MEEKEAHKGKRTPWTLREFGGKTIWDWLQLLVVPLMLALITVVFTWQQDARQQRIEDQRAAAERELAEQQAQDEALQAYLDQMSQLMLDRKLLEAEPGDPVHTLAQARTSTVILRLDAQHNESVTRFLTTSGLAGGSDPGFSVVLPGVPVRSEASASLLSRIVLPHATLSGAFLTDADLNNADLSGADLSGAAFYTADLSSSFLRRADLSDAYLYGADLSKAWLSRADLSEADLSDADLKKANLKHAYLSSASLGDANLKKANLNRAQGISNEELEREASSLDGATMPNGQKYEDWLKDRVKGQQDE